MRCWAAGLLLLLSLADAHAQVVERDSLKSYDLSEIVVGADRDARGEREAIRRISLAALVKEDARDIGAVARLIPSAHTQTNSRGETLLYVRGSGERQTALFLDGALLNVPWDNRIDVGFLPASILGSLSVSHGVRAVTYGPNVTGGAVNMTTRALDVDGSHSELGVRSGSAGMRWVDAMHIRKSGRWQLLAAAGFDRVDGIRNAGEAALPYEPPTPLRVNTDQRKAHLFMRGSYDAGRRLQAGVSMLHVDAGKGVAPEGHLDPEFETVRYWRYPDLSLTLLTANVSTAFQSGSRMGATVWGSRYGQRIDEYENVAFASRTADQADQDLTAGARITGRFDTNAGQIRLAVNTLYSAHRQQERSSADDFSQTATARYSQYLWSVGGEYDYSTDPLRWQVGGSLDGLATPRTGDKPPRDPQMDYGLHVGVATDSDAPWAAWSSLGRRVRFPTPRELFGTALNRFLVNDRLAPETSWMGELGVSLRTAPIELEAALFMNRTFDTIDQEMVELDGTRFRKRINLPGSRVTGVELTTSIRPLPRITIEGHVTISRPVVVEDPDRAYLTEKPDRLGRLDLTWTSRWGGAFSAQAIYTGRAWGLAPDDRLVALPKVVVFNTRAAIRRFFPGTGLFAEAFVRVSNLTDRLILPQLGLPGAGRELVGGLSLAW